VRGSGTAALEVIGHGDLDNRDAALGEKAGNPVIPGQCIPVVKNHQGLIEGPALGDTCPDNIVLGNIRGNVRRTREPFALSFKTLIVAARFVEKGWVSHGLTRQDAKLADRFYIVLAWKGTVGVKGESGC
jgi:hypothetical protein